MKKNNKSEWERKTLEDVMYPVSETFDFQNIHKVHFLNTGDILDGKLLHEELLEVDKLPGQAKKIFKKGDILYSEIRPANKRFMLVNFEAKNSVASTKLMVLRAKENIDTKFLYQFLTSNETIKEFQTIAESRSGTFPQITFDAISYFPILLPPLPEQRAIAAVLSSFDDKIELLRSQNQTLEALAQALFKEWFVDFNFPNAQGKPYKKSGGKMVESELGEIPEKWKVYKLDEISKLVAGGDRPKNTTLHKTKINTIPVYSNGIVHEGLYGYTDIPRIMKESITISARGTIGYVSLREEPYVPIVRLISVTPIQQYLSAKYLFLWLKNQNINGTGTTQQQLTVPDFSTFKIIIPEISIMSKFTNILDSIYKKISANNKQINSLSSTRDSLLSRMMSDGMRVLDFQQK